MTAVFGILGAVLGLVIGIVVGAIGGGMAQSGPHGSEQDRSSGCYIAVPAVICGVIFAVIGGFIGAQFH